LDSRAHGPGRWVSDLPTFDSNNVPLGRRRERRQDDDRGHRGRPDDYGR
jgi:hypothetical protein